MADARFTINGSPSSDRGYDADASDDLLLELEAPTADVYKVQFSAWDPADPDSPLASKDAPALGLDPVDGVALSPNDGVLVTLPAVGVHSYTLRARINDGVEAATGRVVPEWTFERIVSVRSGNGLRKIIPGESTQYSARGWADAQNEEVDQAAAGGAGGGNVFVFPLQAGAVSTALGSSGSRLSLGAVPFDPDVLTASGTRVKQIRFEAILQTSHAAHSAKVDLFDVGAGAVVPFSELSSSALGPTDVMTGHLPIGAGIFRARFWMEPQDSSFVVTCSYAAIVLRIEEP